MGYIIRAIHRNSNEQYELRRNRPVSPGLGTYYHHPSSVKKALSAFERAMGDEVQLWHLTVIPYSQIINERSATT